MNRNWEKVSKYVNKKKVDKYELIRKSLHNVYDILSIIDSLTDQYYMALSFVCMCDWDVDCFCLSQCWRTRKMPTVWRPTHYKMWVRQEGSLSLYFLDIKSDKIKNHPLSAYSFDMNCSCILSNCLLIKA